MGKCMYGWVTCPKCKEKKLIIKCSGHYSCFNCGYTDEVNND